ncbi:lysis protein E [Proteus mirabilis]|uniref:lysis protein E n=1 Tax=Proteus mirabilis TaxID=584 RepID=UPI0021CE35DB|nr:lysis protein E [Proteus mirabilis]MCU6316600.1 lysis protein E [Proteus mirabilis]
MPTCCYFTEGAECMENTFYFAERPVMAVELLAMTLCLLDVYRYGRTDAEENVRQKSRAEGVM